MRAGKSLFGRLSLAFLLILLGLAVSLTCSFLWLWETSSDASEQLIHRPIAATLAAWLGPELSPEVDFRRVRDEVSLFIAPNPKLQVYFIDQGGRLLGDFARDEGARSPHIDMAPIREFLGNRQGSRLPIYGEDPLGPGRKTIFSAAPVEIAGRSGFVYITFGSQLRRSMRTVYRETSAGEHAAIAALAALIALGGIGVVVFAFITRRFRRMTEIVARYAERDYGERLPVRADDEVDRLSRTINSMADSITSQLDELERRDVLRRELIANVAHDLRAPLTLIKGHAEKLLMAADTAALDESVRHLLGISRSTEALGRLLVDLFELAKLEAEELVPVLAPCSVPAILDDLALMYGAAADQNEVSIHVEGPEELPPAIADAALIERAVANLLDNAMRHTPRGGRIVLAASRSEDGSVRIEVSDTGPGIPEASLPLVFDRFYQVDRAGSSPKGLCGLGLAIVRRIVESHGSAIELRSAPGEGTTFAFTLRADSDERWAHT